MYFIQTSLQSAPASLPLTTNQLIVQNEIELQEEITQTASRGTKLIIRNRNMMLRMMQYLAILPPSANLRNKKQHYICDNEKATQTLLETQNQMILYCIFKKKQGLLMPVIVKGDGQKETARNYTWRGGMPHKSRGPFATKMLVENQIKSCYSFRRKQIPH